MGHCQVLLPLCSLQAETAVVGSEQGLPCGSISMVTTGQKPEVDGCPVRPHFLQISLMKRSCRTILNKAWSWWGMVFWEAHFDLPGTEVPMATCLWRMRLTVARVRPTRPAIALCRMPSRASTSTSCLIPIWFGKALLKQSLRIDKNAIVDSNSPQCGGKFWEMTTLAAVLDFDLHWHCSESPVRSDYVGEQ